MTKFTKVDKFNAIINVLNGSSSAISIDELTEFCYRELELLDKKKSRGSKPSANQLANENFKTEIVNILTENDRPMTISEITSELSDSTLSNQKVSSLITQLKNAGTIERIVIKKKAYFSIAE